MSFRAHQISGQLAQEHAALSTTVVASTRAFPDIATAGSRVVRMRSGSTAPEHRAQGREPAPARARRRRARALLQRLL